MKARPADPLLRDIHTLFHVGSTGGLTDGELLARFVASGDEAAFEVLVHRLGPMVLGVCRRLLVDPHDAEDAFQATFLVLARRAASVEPDRVGSFLYGVARQVATRARAVRARRRTRERTGGALPEPAIGSDYQDDLPALLDRELGRLPEKYRAPIVLCHLEGKPYKEAARELGWREGTLAGRLTRGRALLAARLTRLGVATSAGALAFVLTKEASARMPASWAASAAGMACGIRGGVPAAVAAGAAALAKGTLRTMLMTRLRVASAALVAVGVIGVGAAAGRGDDPKPAPKEAAQARPADPVALRWTTGPVHLSEFLYENNRDEPAKAAEGSAGRVERVDAYKIGDDLYLNFAPTGSGRLVLEKVANWPAQASDAARAKEAPTPKRPDSAATREEVVRALTAINSELADVFLVDHKANPADPNAAGRLYEILVEGRDNAGDAQFVRRLYLDLLGRVPTADEVKAYVDSSAPDKAEALAHRLVDDPAAIARIKQSLLRRVEASVAQTRKPAPKPVTFTIADATLDRVNVPAGNLIDVHLDNGPHDAKNPAADQQTTLGRHNGQLISTVSPPATRILGLPVAVDAPIGIESESGEKLTSFGTGEAALNRLKPGMRLTLEIVAEGYMLAVRSITARPASQTTADPGDPFNLYFKPAEPQQRR